MNTQIKHDYMNGNRDLNLDLTMQEADQLYFANDKVKEMAESGELQKLHQRCADLNNAVETGFLKAIDQLDRANAQITQTEQEAYEGLTLDRLQSHNGDSIANVFSSNNVSIENNIIVQSAAEGNNDIGPQANQIRQLIGARAAVMQAKVELLEHMISHMFKDDHAAIEDLRESKILRDEYTNAYGEDVSEVTGDAKIFKE